MTRATQPFKIGDHIDVDTRSSIKANHPAPKAPYPEQVGGVNRFTISPFPGTGVDVQTGALSLVEDGTVFLVWKDEIVDSTPVIIRENVIYNFHVSANWIRLLTPDNTVETIDTWYFSTSQFGDDIRSDVLTLLVDLAPPGGIPDPDPPHDGINPKLAPIPELEGTPRPPPPPTPGRSFIMTIPAWENMTVGDELYVRWGSQPILGPYVVRDGDVGKPYEVIVPGGLIGADNVPVNYYLIDKVRNRSYDSRPQGSLSDDGDGGNWNLRAPSVSARNGQGPTNLIPADALDVDALATIPGMSVTEPPVPIFRAGDEIQLYWDNTPVGDPVQVPAAGADLSIVVPSTVLKTHSPGVWNVWYEARRSTALPPSARSPGQPVEVKAAGGLLPGDGRPLRAAKWLAPARRPDDPARQILPSDVALDKGTKLRIYQYTNMAPGDRLDMSFEGHEELDPRSRVLPGTPYSHTYFVTANDLIEKVDDSVRPPVSAVFIDVHVPELYFSPFQKFGSATFEYEVTNAAGQGFSERNFIGDHYVYVAIR